jgi:hypothetical protein
MIEIYISDSQISRAEKLYNFNELNGSITKGKSNIYGAIGEIIVYDYFLDYLSIIQCNTFDYDFIINDFKVDVKTKRTTVKPKDNYLCSISSFNIKQKCDYYFFIRVLESFKIGYMLGFISKDEFYKKAVFNKVGEKDNNYFKFKDDCYNIEISQLNKFKKRKNA